MERVRVLGGVLQRHVLLSDSLLAVLVLAVSLQPLLQSRGCSCAPPPAWGYLLVVGSCAPLALRRRAPFSTGLLVGLLCAVLGLTDVPEAVVPFAALVGVYTVAAYARRRLALLAAGIAAVALAATLLLDASSADLQDYTVNYLVFASAWLLGDSARSRRDRALQAEARADQLERTRAVEAERVVLAERARIAREMHDVVAHHVSIMVVQAEAGPVVVERAPERAVAAFDAISATGRQALVEMRQLLGVLRPGDDDRLAPQPGLDGLPSLGRSLAEAGLPVQLVVTGDRRPLTPAVELSAYRVVQEALTNALRHAAPSGTPVTARVAVTYTPDALQIEVTDDGVQVSDRGAHAGSGLVGMRERALLVGGRLHAGPREGGGWAVRAVLPLEPVSA